MAVFDKKKPRKSCLDDTDTLSVTIENAQTINGHTEYIIKVQRGPQPDQYWIISKRYSDFVALHQTIQSSGISIVLPPKKLIGNMDKAFIAQRQVELQSYLNSVLANPILALSLTVRKFLDPLNYAASLQELALQHVFMALRSEINYQVVKPILELGWRPHKHYFTVKSQLKPKVELLLQWVEYGPDKYLDEKDLQDALQCLVSLNHPNLEKLEYTHCGERGCFTVQQFHQCGTLRDLVYGTKPKLTFLKKYGVSKASKPVPLHEVSLYGRQIIETLIFLHEKGLPHGHLHLGNILLVDGNIRLLDIQNTILGLPSLYRPFIVQHRRINSLEAVDVYSLGHVLFEMAFGYPLNESVCDNVPPSCPPLLGVLLESILSTESCKVGLPSLQELLQHPFFNVTAKDNLTKVNFKLTSGLKQSLREAVSRTEKRLQSDQRAIRNQKKLTKMQELLTSEDGLSRRKQKLKEEKSSSSKHVKGNRGHPNGRRSPRSDSLTSNSTAPSIGAMTPPLSAAKISPPTPVNSSSTLDGGRSALLDSICAFDKSILRHQTTTVHN